MWLQGRWKKKKFGGHPNFRGGRVGGIVTKTVIALYTSKYNSALGKGYQVFPAIHLLGLLDPIAVYKAMCADIWSVTTWEI